MNGKVYLPPNKPATKSSAMVSSQMVLNFKISGILIFSDIFPTKTNDFLFDFSKKNKTYLIYWLVLNCRLNKRFTFKFYWFWNTILNLFLLIPSLWHMLSFSITNSLSLMFFLLTLKWLFLFCCNHTFNSKKIPLSRYIRKIVVNSDVKSIWAQHQLE